MNFKDIRRVTVGISRQKIDSDGKPMFKVDGTPVIEPMETQQIENIDPQSNHFEYYFDHFYKSAEVLKEEVNNQNIESLTGSVPVFLYLHALELYLKSKLYFLEGNPSNIESFGRKYGHNIVSLLNDIESKCSINWKHELTPGQIQRIQSTGGDYSVKMYNYSDRVEHSRPLFTNTSDIKEIVDKIISNVR